PAAPPWAELVSSGALAPPLRADLPDPPHHTGAGRGSLHNVRALRPKPSAESARRWRLAGIRSPQPPLRGRTAPGPAAVAPKLSDPHGARRTSRNTRDRDFAGTRSTDTASRATGILRQQLGATMTTAQQASQQ